VNSEVVGRRMSAESRLCPRDVKKIRERRKMCHGRIDRMEFFVEGFRLIIMFSVMSS
jgi:hypothetical protein